MHAESVVIPFEIPLREAVFVARPNRFIGVFHWPGDDTHHQAHIADPGRLQELLIAGARVLIADYGEHTRRKLRYSMPLVYSPPENDTESHLVSINSQLPNRIIRHLLVQNCLPHYLQYKLVRREFTYGQSRIDFLLESPGQKPHLLEVKGASLVENGWCKFPDAPTLRGTRHLQELIAAKADGYETSVIFVVQRTGAQYFTPHQERDPLFSETLGKAIRAGVRCHAFCIEMTPTHCQYTVEIPVILPGNRPSESRDE